MTSHSSNDVEIWILGTGTAALASALFLLKYNSIKPFNIHLLDSHSSVDQVLHYPGNSGTGYDQFAGCLPVPIGAPLRDLLSSIPSSQNSRISIFEEINNRQKQRYPVNHNQRTCFVIKKNDSLEQISTDHLNLSIRQRLKLLFFMLKSEDSLGRSQIREHFSEKFFKSIFWAVWSAQFCFQPWHSATEFKNSLKQYLHEFQGLSILNCLDITGYYQHECIFLPIYHYLRSLGVDYLFNAKVKEISFAIVGHDLKPQRLSFSHREHIVTRNIGPNDCLIAALGSTVSGSQKGTNSQPPQWNSIWSNDNLDDNWSLWLELGNKDRTFGDPYNFCARQSESMLESFTITTEDTVLFQDFEAITRQKSQAGTYISLQESSWKLVLCVPLQPVFADQPRNVRVPMLHCSGSELLTEICRHLGLTHESARHRTITIPRVMPRMSAAYLTRQSSDRPCTKPKATSNIGLIGQFVDLPPYTAVDLSYGIRTAEAAVSQLLDSAISDPERKVFFGT
ncbi:67 kDa myosin-cross-reactive antigen like family protein [Aspergillus uvarum CBS 121591]|uniref:67 kDa myosin-cross-reactive antigen like family protein n=1 Tax=Aspergillus uvarum CBS 121591 TaxID=1448315 RepID=A0A319C9N1_9EURO|nr:67 kDa myosin-cross-reactive antigen like family protein [Aspergillus uvarum CBS 121591]PYH80581.1 67 kDa myosin-cross-reactive antigen like family protein [Aspergillus uvarum CBS 121591]